MVLGGLGSLGRPVDSAVVWGGMSLGACGELSNHESVFRVCERLGVESA